MADEIALFERMARELYVAVISDTLDALGYREQVMTANIRPIRDDPSMILVGRAATQLIVPQHETRDQPYTRQIEALDALQPGDVAVLSSYGQMDMATWGELFSNAAIARGARGTVIDGYHRDTRKMLDLGYPVFSTGARPTDISARGEVAAYDVPIRCGGVMVHPGDIIFAEIDGIAVIPRTMLNETVERAFTKVATEDRARDDLRAGATLGDVWQRYKVL